MTYSGVAVGRGEVGVEVWVMPVGHPGHDHLGGLEEIVMEVEVTFSTSFMTSVQCSGF